MRRRRRLRGNRVLHHGHLHEPILDDHHHLRAHCDLPGRLWYAWLTTTLTHVMQTNTAAPADCVSGGGGQSCCSTYCAATKCRPTDPEWPGCREDNGPCLADENCCYNNKCVEGLCTRP